MTVLSLRAKSRNPIPLTLTSKMVAGDPFTAVGMTI